MHESYRLSGMHDLSFPGVFNIYIQVPNLVNHVGPFNSIISYFYRCFTLSISAVKNRCSMFHLNTAMHSDLTKAPTNEQQWMQNWLQPGVINDVSVIKRIIRSKRPFHFSSFLYLNFKKMSSWQCVSRLGPFQEKKKGRGNIHR